MENDNATFNQIKDKTFAAMKLNSRVSCDRTGVQERLLTKLRRKDIYPLTTRSKIKPPLTKSYMIMAITGS